MAEFALGLTRKAVEVTLGRVTSALEEEAEVNERVAQDLAFITGEFQMMQSFLGVVTNAERANDRVLRTWVRQLRDVAFDVEDWVELVVHLEDDRWAWWRRMVPLPSCVTQLLLPPRPLDEAADEIKLLKARVEEVSQRYTRYNLTSSDDSGYSKPAEEQPASVPAFHILREAWETECGLGLHDLITSTADDLGVISVWSSAGGAAAALGILIRAYGDPKVCQEFKRRAWVKLTDPFDRHGFCKSLLAQFYPDDADEMINSQQQVLDINHCLQRLNKDKYLVILEQVSSVAQWDAIRNCLLDSNNGSPIVVSTTQLGVVLNFLHGGAAHSTVRPLMVL